MRTPVARRLALMLSILAGPVPALAGASDLSYPAGAPRIASDYHSWTGVNGLRRSAQHQGIDIKGPPGMAIIAAADGVVLETDVGPCWGPTVVIDHGPGPDGRPIVAAYGHLGEFIVRPGQRVSRGQPVARLGDNHRQFRCMAGVRHLHFQIGRRHRGMDKGTYWGHLRYLVDGQAGVNPHQYWADGPGRVTCFTPGRQYRAGTLTYPVPCR